MQAVRTPKVTVIPAKKDIPLCALSTEAQAKLLRVAAYARVSTDSAEQLTSYRAQVDYYTRYIAGHDGSRSTPTRAFPARRSASARASSG